MDLIQPRAVYQRANTDEPTSLGQSNSYELRSVNSIQSFSSSKFIDQAPLLEYSPDYNVQGQPPPSLSVTIKAFWANLIPKRLHGWKLGALSASILATFSLIINFVAAVWLGSHKQGASLVEVYRGNCDTVKEIDLWAHLAINALSTLLLGGSNYCMQCLCAPTRADVDRVHQKQRFVDIGVPSFRNLRAIPRHKSVLWWILALSSIPLHLLYNSAFYKSLATNDYDIIFVTNDFVEGNIQYNQTWNLRNVGNLTFMQGNLTDPAKFERLEIPDCVRSYAVDFPSDRRNLLFVVPDNNVGSNFTVLDIQHYKYDSNSNFKPYDGDWGDARVTWGIENPFGWICNSDRTTSDKVDVPRDGRGYVRPCSSWYDRIIELGDNWLPYRHEVDHCYSELVEETCSYSGNVPIIAVVILCNFVKMVCMFITAFRLGTGSLITVGDAVASFLEEPDRHTRGQCLVTRDEAVQTMRRQMDLGESKPLPAAPKVAKIQQRKWASSVSWLRWIYTISLLALALLVSSILLHLALGSIRDYGLPPMSIPFGAVNPAAIVTGWSISSTNRPSQSIFLSILIANLPQTIFSFLYLNLNGLLTTMWLAAEWSDFAVHRKTLRTSLPRGEQRSKHFLQLPYKISLPVMLLSGVLHWLISQSIFLAVVAEYNPLGELDSSVAVATCGFSPAAIIVTIVIGAVIIITTIALGQRKYNGSIPLVSSCSLAISAACHRPEWDTDAAFKAVQWGVIPARGVVKEESDIGHCSFTSGTVQPLQDGKEYAGDWKLE